MRHPHPLRAVIKENPGWPSPEPGSKAALARRPRLRGSSACRFLFTPRVQLTVKVACCPSLDKSSQNDECSAILLLTGSALFLETGYSLLHSGNRLVCYQYASHAAGILNVLRRVCARHWETVPLCIKALSRVIISMS